jgi:TRAP transporter TAXI family solute receptor
MKLHQLIIGAIATLLAGAAQSADIVIGSSAVGGSYYLYAGGLATYLSSKTPDIKATARTTRGSVENARLLDRKAMDLAFINASVLYEQKIGTVQFKDAKSDRLRAVVLVDLAPTHVVTLASLNIKKLQDLRGKRVSIGAAGSGGANSALVVLNALGIRNDVRIQNLGFEESANNLRDGNLEAFMGGSALPMPAVIDLATTQNIRLLSFEESFIRKLQATDPATEITVIPANTYRGVDYRVTTIGTPSALVTHADMPADVVYAITKVLLQPDNKKYMQTIYRAWNPEVGAELWKRIGVPLHPGAERAYREAGVLK